MLYQRRMLKPSSTDVTFYVQLRNKIISSENYRYFCIKESFLFKKYAYGCPQSRLMEGEDEF